MDIKKFEYKMRDYKFAPINNDIIIFKLKGGKWEVYDAEKDTSEVYDSLNNERIISIVKQLDKIEFNLDGGRGASSGSKTHALRGAGGSRGGNTRADLPVKINSKIKVKSTDEAINAFRKQHGESKKEHLIAVTRDGFVNGYNHGGEGSVGLGRFSKGDLIVHNHPNNSSFSPNDMLSAASTNTRGVVATHSRGYRIFTKGTHFNSTGFTNAVKKSTTHRLKR